MRCHKLAGPLDAVRIVPFTLNSKDARGIFLFELLKTLWSERIETWKPHLDNGTELVGNHALFYSRQQGCLVSSPSRRLRTVSHWN